ncbi:MAG: class I SAM-dependent methyltransferase [Desulfobacteraceae bacterium]|nr:MAG: class I SAM-dependent methyltransferase [Desulfobacteraceae bacterium]
MDDRLTGLIDRTKGFLDKEEGFRLYTVARDAGRLGPCLEIGSYCGKSTLYLGAGCREAGSVLFSVDHHTGSEEQQPGEGYFDPETYDVRQGRMDTFPLFRKALIQGDLEDTVVPIVSKSAVAARRWATPLGLVFIDGGHSFPAAFTDYQSWVGHIMPGGYLMVHDIFKNPEEGGQAPYYVYQKALASGLFHELPMTKTLGVLKRLACGELPEDLPK